MKKTVFTFIAWMLLNWPAANLYAAEEIGLVGDRNPDSTTSALTVMEDLPSPDEVIPETVLRPEDEIVSPTDIRALAQKLTEAEDTIHTSQAAPAAPRHENQSKKR